MSRAVPHAMPQTMTMMVFEPASLTITAPANHRYIRRSASRIHRLFVDYSSAE
jgi:hypothetical protein